MSSLSLSALLARERDAFLINLTIETKWPTFIKEKKYST